MSTYIYLTCKSHVPALRADNESGQHLYDLARTREQIANREQVVAEYEAKFSVNWSFANNTAAFLAEHKTCEIGIVDEYGVEHEIVEEPAADVGDMELTLTVRELRKIKAEVWDECWEYTQDLFAMPTPKYNPYVEVKNV